MRYLRQRDSSIGLQVVAGPAQNPSKGLTEGTVDLAIVYGEKAHSGADLMHLFDDELLFIMAPDHRLAGRAYITGQDIVGEDYMIYTRIPASDREYAKLFRPNETFPNWTETMELPEAIVEMVAAGLGTSVLASWAVQNSIKSKRIVGARVGPDGISIPWYAATRPGKAKEDQYNRRVAKFLAEWSRATGGFSASEESRQC